MILKTTKTWQHIANQLDWLGRCCSVFSVYVIATVKVPQTAPLTSLNMSATGPSTVPTRQQQRKTLSFHPNLVDADSFTLRHISS